MNFRAIGMFCFLLVIVGFFMPWVTQLNGFQFADLMISQDHISSILIYVWFVFALAGLIIGVPLLLKKNVSRYLDLSIVIVCFDFPFAFLLGKSFERIQSSFFSELKGAVIALINPFGKIQSGFYSELKGAITALINPFEGIQFGFYVILIGTIAAFVFQIVSAVKPEVTNKVYLQ